MIGRRDISLRVRTAGAFDCEAILEIQRHSPEAAQWSQSSYEDAVRDGGLLLIAERLDPPPEAGESSAAKSVGEEAHPASLKSRQTIAASAGFLLARCAADEAEILNLAVRSEARRCGVGSALLHEAISWAKSKSAATVHLEVRASNIAALRFYEDYGFLRAGIRPRYYANPPEDGVLLCAPIASHE